MTDGGRGLGHALAAAQFTGAVLVEGPGDPDRLAALRRRGGGGQALGGARHGLAEEEIDVRGKQFDLLAILRKDFIARPDQIGAVAATQRRQAAGDRNIAPALLARLAGEIAGQAVQLGVALLDALLGELAADDAISIRGDDIRTGSDVVAMDLAHGLGCDD